MKWGRVRKRSRPLLPRHIRMGALWITGGGGLKLNLLPKNIGQLSHLWVFQTAQIISLVQKLSICSKFREAAAPPSLPPSPPLSLRRVYNPEIPQNLFIFIQGFLGWRSLFSWGDIFKVLIEPQLLLRERGRERGGRGMEGERWGERGERGRERGRESYD